MNIAIPAGNGEFHLLTNDNLKVGDKVFPLADTYHNNGKIYLTGLRLNVRDWGSEFARLACTGWPSEPHTVSEFYVEDGISYIRTDKGYSPAMVYFKVIE